MNTWITQLVRALETEPAMVRVVVASVLGSAPREPGATMVVGVNCQYGSIGGGNLEYRAVEIARAMLRKPRSWRIVRFPLGPALAQCCGGFVELWLERYEAQERDVLLAIKGAPGAVVMATVAENGVRTQRHLLTAGCRPVNPSLPSEPYLLDAAASVQTGGASVCLISSEARAVLVERLTAPQRPLFVFGAGHVGGALIKVLVGLPFAVTWIDSREGRFPSGLPENVSAKCVASPVEEISRAPAGAAYVVLTHNHALDYDLCRAILLRGDFSFAGLIGSETKAARFAHRFARDGIPSTVSARLQCPIGIGSIASKLPSAIAVSIAAQLLSLGEGHHEQMDRRDAEHAESDRARRSNSRDGQAMGDLRKTIDGA